MKIPYLGKVRLHWCDDCQVPLIRKHCSTCGNSGQKLKVTPPGDIRPAFDGDLSRLIKLVETQYGAESANIFRNMIKDQILLLNKVPYIDRMDEIYYLGKAIGLLRFNPLKEDFELLPKLALARKLWHKNTSHWVEVDIGAREPIKNGASVLTPGITKIHGEINLNDPTMIVCRDEVIAVGLAKMDSRTMLNSPRGVAIKTKYRKESSLPAPLSHSSWKKIIDANHQSLTEIEVEALNFIEKSAQNYKEVVVAYSGGKDSLATLNLVAQSDVPYGIIFADTGLEYPETLENVELIGKIYGRKVLVDENETWDFWDRFEQFGPPTRNSRWCCKSAKLAPVNSILEKNFPDAGQVLTFLGKRRYESLGRSQEPRISQNPWIPKQVSASPINNWNAFEVYLYIKARDLMELLNPLYNKGFIRIGCWVCPASSLADFSIMEKTHPNLLNKLNSRLARIKSGRNFPRQYISWGLWRWKLLPSKVLKLLKGKNIDYKIKDSSSESSSHLQFFITQSPSPCILGGFSSYISANQLLELELVDQLLPIIGKTNFNEELDVLYCSDSKGCRTDLFRDGSVIVRDDSKDILEIKAVDFAKTIFRITFCDGCGICTFNCEEEALFLESGKINVDSEKCIHCMKCNSFCPLLRYRSDTSYVIKDD
ncbi:MAG: phosphoadenosine phosphosulfate reductase domain-containing protein [Candidatus Hodarchaeales archaeon]